MSLYGNLTVSFILTNLLTSIMTINSIYCFFVLIQLSFEKVRNELVEIKIGVDMTKILVYVTNSFVIHFSKWKGHVLKEIAHLKLQNGKTPLNTRINMNSLVLLFNLSHFISL